MEVFVVSDFHLFDRPEPFLFHAKKEACFQKLAGEILARGARLVCAGDIFDFSGLTPCRFGMSEFFSEVLPPEKRDAGVITRACEPRTTAQLVASIKEVFPGFFATLGSLAQKNSLDFIPGNHDCELLEKENQLAFERAIGAPPGGVRWQREFRFEERLLVRHGNEFDSANRTDKGCLNPGQIFTSALYRAMLPALSLLGVPEAVVHAIPAVRPEEETLNWLEESLGEAETKNLLRALVRLLYRNGFFSGPSALPGYLLTRHVPIASRLIERGITVDRVRKVLPDDALLKREARKGAATLRSGDAPFVVLGHTHVLDVQSNYVNLGTWIDHLTGLSAEQLRNPDRTLPVFHYASGRQPRTIDVRGLNDGLKLEDCPTLA